MIEHVSSMYEVLGSIPVTIKKNREIQRARYRERQGYGESKINVGNGILLSHGRLLRSYSHYEVHS